MQRVAPEAGHAIRIVMIDMGAGGQPKMLICRGAWKVFQGADPEIHIGAGLGVDLSREGDQLFDLIKLKSLEAVKLLRGWITPADLKLAPVAFLEPEAEAVIHSICIGLKPFIACHFPLPP